MNINVSIEINATKSEVWQAITDFEHCKDMISAIIDFKVLHQPTDSLIGFKWAETRQVFGKESTETMWITQCQDEAFYTTRAENCGAIYETKLSIAEVGENTQLSMSFSGSSDSFFIRIVSTVMGLLIKKSMIKMLEQDLADIKKYVEQKNVAR